jgi:haloalkane dehalogenase
MMSAYSQLETIRTPAERFENLEDYPFEENYIDIEGLRMHYVDEGPREGKVVLMLHGEPSWSYLYRKMIPIFSEAGYRAIAPDLIGFGKSDKLVSQSDYSFQFHIDVVTSFIEQMQLKQITLFCQDWGGLIGLRIVADHQELFAWVVAGNTGLAGAPPRHENLPAKDLVVPMVKTMLGFGSWFAFSQLTPDLKIGQLIDLATTTKLNKEVKRAYDAPFPDKRYKAGARVFPRLVPTQRKECKKAWEKLMNFEKPFLTVFSDKDPILGSMGFLFQRLVPGAQGINHPVIKNAGHFLQEDKGEELAQLTIKLMREGNV